MSPAIGLIFKTQRPWATAILFLTAAFGAGLCGCEKPDAYNQKNIVPVTSPAETTKPKLAPVASQDRMSGKKKADEITVTGLIAGHWVIDNNESVTLTIQANRGLGLSADQLQQMVRDEFGKMVMTIDFLDDGTFICHQKTKTGEGYYTGFWSYEDRMLTVSQTHRDEEPEVDEMVGTVQGTNMLLEHFQRGVMSKIALDKIEQQ